MSRAKRTIGQRILTARRAAGMTQTELADALNRAGVSLPQGHISAIERGQRSPYDRSVNHLLAIANALDCDVRDLVPE